MHSIKRLLSTLRRRGADSLWYQTAVGGHWDDVGRGQFEFLLREGLRPEHTLLDVACGSLRSGRFLIEYLDEGRYCGIDGNPALLEAGRRQVLAPRGLLKKRPKLVEIRLTGDPVDFDQVFGMRFDYIWIHALFDHIPHQTIWQCLTDLRPALAPAGRMYATIFASDSQQPVVLKRNGSLEGAVTTYPDQEYWHHSPESFTKVPGPTWTHVSKTIGTRWVFPCCASSRLPD